MKLGFDPIWFNVVMLINLCKKLCAACHLAHMIFQCKIFL